MNLQEFIEETLVEISQGIEAANKKLNVNDHCLYAKYVLKDSKDDLKNSLINFDVAVTTKLEAKGEGKGKFKLFVADADLSASGNIANEKVSRVKFSVSANKTVGYTVNKD
ncbi:hypothetical protein L1077_22065 [Pseudoalteromonas luteoviolacea]|uniref:hypothetical protein n=1 Tax=Pseudoalteromonas luteoviolacea TaxID=43657 RepID=UPI001B3A3F9C|nr:hypothetical protein [Pseudoalteromonas luteoviolacea]MBQ4880203.1 hypothetical protein [Pseudoalteromonas luteoviolacea]MBQ4909264.1 hypothetical protein [Pseudoalteromonas luteoviolacea]MCF6442116.1 hypothetical protein [Pseudoalteromonas luteoviolacea]